MKKNKNIIIVIMLIVLSLILFLPSCVSEKPKETTETTEQSTQSETETNTTNNIETEIEEENNNMKLPEKSSIIWEAEQALPIFATSEEKLYTIHTSSLTPDERITISALQGIVNKTKPRILLTEDGDIPADTWAKTFNLNTVKLDPYIMIGKYKDEIKGLVVYNTTQSEHYRNVAATIANIKGYLPVSVAIMKTLVREGIEFENMIVLPDDWTETTPLEIYERLYNEYWKDCTKRLILSANPKSDFDHCRDIAAAAGAAVVWLDCTKSDERELYQKFMKDMADNREKNHETAIVMGWFTTERSGVTASSEYGISTVPADLFISGSVYSGASYNADSLDKSREINIPKVPLKKDVANNKVYVAVFFTDGDNIQYVQRFMRKLWDSEDEKNNRGKVPVSWTISPSLVDIAPGMLNYYYSLASDYECFVAGPSGMGYLMPVNTLKEPGAKVGEYLVNKDYINEYTKLTERYMRKAGLRALTIWDDANADLREAYEKNCKYLYGLTIQNFGDREVFSEVINSRLWFARHETHYEGVYKTVLNDMTKKIRAYNKSNNDENNGLNKPCFLSYQVKVWEFQTKDLVKLHDEIKQKFDGEVEIEFVRADHFFALYNEANNLSFNLCLNEKTIIEKDKDNQAINFDFGAVYNVTRFAVPADVKVELSEDGVNWTVFDGLFGDVDIVETVKARYARLTHKTSVDLNTSGVEFYGNVVG